MTITKIVHIGKSTQLLQTPICTTLHILHPSPTKYVSFKKTNNFFFTFRSKFRSQGHDPFKSLTINTGYHIHIYDKGVKYTSGFINNSQRSHYLTLDCQQKVNTNIYTLPWDILLPWIASYTPFTLLYSKVLTMKIISTLLTYKRLYLIFPNIVCKFYLLLTYFSSFYFFHCEPYSTFHNLMTITKILHIGKSTQFLQTPISTTLHILHTSPTKYFSFPNFYI